MQPLCGVRAVPSPPKFLINWDFPTKMTGDKLQMEKPEPDTSHCSCQGSRPGEALPVTAGLWGVHPAGLAQLQLNRIRGSGFHHFLGLLKRDKSSSLSLIQEGINEIPVKTWHAALSSDLWHLQQQVKTFPCGLVTLLGTNRHRNRIIFLGSDPYLYGDIFC